MSDDGNRATRPGAAAGWTIRRARAADARGAARCHTRAIRVLGRSHYTARETASWARGLDESFYILALRKTDLFEVAEGADGTIAGIAAARGNETWLLYTDPDWTGRGIGSALLKRMEDDIRARGHATLRVESSLAAQSFYERHGYRRRRIYGHRTRGGMVLAALTMTKPA